MDANSKTFVLGGQDGAFIDDLVINVESNEIIQFREFYYGYTNQTSWARTSSYQCDLEIDQRGYKRELYISVDDNPANELFYGPCKFSNFNIDRSNPGSYPLYKIVYEINEIDKPAKDYRISLDNDGNRLAVAQREGTNTVIQTFEFDGSSWNQIGDDLEF